MDPDPFLAWALVAPGVLAGVALALLVFLLGIAARATTAARSGDALRAAWSARCWRARP